MLGRIGHLTSYRKCVNKLSCTVVARRIVRMAKGTNKDRRYMTDI
jgi:hypothetical protein